MTREDAESVTVRMAKPVLAYLSARCTSVEDAEDLSQEILFRAYRTLLGRNDVGDPERYVWRCVRNGLANYYRGKARLSVGIPLDEVADCLPDPEDPYTERDDGETVTKLRSEIAFLSAERRRIVAAYYFDHRTTEIIARDLGIPAGTVKWHLFEARKELKERLKQVRDTEQLSFHPIRFTKVMTNGGVGSMGGNDRFFRSILSQNIAYSVYREPKSVREIAKDLGVSPVYVEGEADFLEEYGFLIRRGDRYSANILIEEPDSEECALREKIYDRGAELIGDGLCNALISSGLLEDTDHLWGGVSGPMSMTENPPRDRNLMLWTLVPYLAAVSGQKLQEAEAKVSFEEAATVRPDGGHNICEAWIEPDGIKPILPESCWCGPCWNRWDGFCIWQTDSPWSGRRVTDNYTAEAMQDRSLLIALSGGAELRPEETARLCERGYIAAVRENGCVKTGFRCVWIDGGDMNRRLIGVGDRAKENCWEEIRKLKQPYIDMVLKRTPERLRTMQAFGLGYLFHSDGAFIYRCMKRLLDTGRLTLPEEPLRRSLTLAVIDERE